MSLSPKIDEVREEIRCGNYEFVSRVETWLQSHIHDNIINIQGYNLIRRDRVEGTHGGVCVYIKDSRDAGTTGAAGASAPHAFCIHIFWVQCGCRLWVQRVHKRFKTNRFTVSGLFIKSTDRK
jgi:hypothetical protein